MIWDGDEILIYNAETIEVSIRLTFPRVCFKYWLISFLIILVVLIRIKCEHKPLFYRIGFNIVDGILSREGLFSRVFDEF